MNMNKNPAFAQLKAYARLDALWLTALWLASFVWITRVPQSMVGSFLVLSTPLVLWLLMQRFRNTVLGGVISFRRGWAYGAYLTFYASLLFALLQWMYLRWVDGGHFLQQLSEGFSLSAQIYQDQLSEGLSLPAQTYQDMGVTPQTLEQARQLLPQLPITQLVLMFWLQNVLTGVFLSLPIAALCRRSTPPRQSQQH